MDIKTETDETLKQIAAAAELAQLEQLRVAGLGKKGFITIAMAQLGKLSKDERGQLGAELNQLKTKLTTAITARRALLEQDALQAKTSPRKKRYHTKRRARAAARRQTSPRLARYG